MFDQLPQKRVLSKYISPGATRLRDRVNVFPEPTQLTLCGLEIPAWREERRKERIYCICFADEGGWDARHGNGGFMVGGMIGRWRA